VTRHEGVIEDQYLLNEIRNLVEDSYTYRAHCLGYSEDYVLQSIESFNSIVGSESSVHYYCQLDKFVTGYMVAIPNNQLKWVRFFCINFAFELEVREASKNALIQSMKHSNEQFYGYNQIDCDAALINTYLVCSFSFLLQIDHHYTELLFYLI
jgi:hypothetical protein